VTEGHAVARSDAQVANLIANRTLPRCKPLFIVFPIGIFPQILQRTARCRTSVRPARNWI
jgi:hypothetical protein